jgi:glycosyltransferase involved in cell wall biosynthesis
MIAEHTTRPSISVIVPVYNGGQNFSICLSCLSVLVPAPLEVIVVDDCSNDGSGQLAAERGFSIQHTVARCGPARARNLGARLAQGEILFFVDADVALAPDAIDRLTGAFMWDPAPAAVFGSYDDAPAAPNFLSQYKNLLHHYVHQTAREDASTFWAGCGAIRRDVFLGLGGFAESYREPSIEDIELGYRLMRAGYHIRLLKALQAKHLKRWTVRSLLQSDIKQRALPWSELILSTGGLVDDLNTGWSGRLSVAATFGMVAALVLGVLWPPMLALAAGLAAALLALNWPLYMFFLRKRGGRFALAAIPWHWLYFLYSGLAFALAGGRHVLKVPGRRRERSRTGDGSGAE